MERRRFIIIGVGSPALRTSLKEYFENQIEGSVVFLATDGTDLMIKSSRTKPNLVVFSADLPKRSAVEVYLHLKETFPKDPIAFLYLGAVLPEQMQDDHSLGTVTWVSSPDPEKFPALIAQALNAIGETSHDFRVRHLAKGEVLMNQGEEASNLYFVIKGSLKACREEDGQNIVLGTIASGEFVGEMGVINDEKHVATVLADEVCQLLEIPKHDFNKAVLTRPSWAKVLISTLTRRLKTMNTLVKRN